MRTKSVASSALLLLSTAMVMGCRSTQNTSGRLMYDFLPHDPAKVERILEKTKSGGSEEQLIALASVSGPSKKKLRALRDETIESYDGGGPAALGVQALPASLQASVQGVAHDAAFAAPLACEDNFCAGVASRSLDPYLWDPAPPDLPLLTDLPSSWFLRLLTGTSQPPLAGYFRLRLNFLGTAIRFAFPNHYYAHAFKDSQGSAPGGPTIQVKALALQGENGEKVFWVRTDLIGAFQDLRQAVLQGLHNEGMPELEQGQLLLHGTHTHSGLGALNPRLFPQVLTVDRFVEPIFDAVSNQIIEAILEADQDLQPARIGVGMAERSDLTRNRRGTCTAKGDPPSPDPDPTIGILRIDRDDNDEPLATVFNFAVHGTSLSDDNLLLSPDNMGWAEWFIEQEIGGMALFFNGAQGDITPRGAPDDTELPREAYIGKELSNTVVAARPGILTTDEARLRWKHCHLDQPDRPDGKGCPAEFELENFQLRPLMFLEYPQDSDCYIDRGDGPWVIQITKEDDPPKVEREGAVMGAFLIETGPELQATSTLVMTMPGEPIRDIGMLMKANAPAGADNAWVFGLSNAHMGYIVTEEEYGQGGYEAGANFFGPTEGERLMSIAASLAEELFQ